uniref:Uncharacterized protein n=1 Tax=Haemonchus contortus TaxID=6289 RepID=W6NDE9_HAECO
MRYSTAPRLVVPTDLLGIKKRVKGRDANQRQRIWSIIPPHGSPYISTLSSVGTCFEVIDFTLPYRQIGQLRILKKNR